MSILAGRLAATEGAYFRRETKQAVNRLIQNNPQIISSSSSSDGDVVENEGQAADVLPEVLRHSLPTQISEPPPCDSSIFTTNKWIIRNDPNKVYAFSSLPSDARNPLRAYVSLPQVTMGPKRWQLPDGEYSLSASTVNSLRRERDTPYDPEKLKAAEEGLSHDSYKNVKYNLALKDRHAKRDDGTDPIVLEEMWVDNEWIVEKEGPVLPNDTTWLNIVDCFMEDNANGAGESSHRRRRPRDLTKSLKGKNKEVQEDDGDFIP